jgi:hypothetical protein
MNHIRFSITIAVDPPPPLHKEAIPYLPLLAYRTFIKESTTLAPLIPIGWPIAIAPPFTFTLLTSKSINLRLASTVTAKASLIS